MEQSGKWVDATSVKTFRWLPEHRSLNLGKREKNMGTTDGSAHPDRGLRAAATTEDDQVNTIGKPTWATPNEQPTLSAKLQDFYSV